MKISLASNYDNNLVDIVKKYPVYEIYGKLKNDFIGGGRPDISLEDIEVKKFEEHVKKVRDAGINFNYLLNGSCLSNKEQDSNWQKEFISFLNYLKKIGVNSLTVTNPNILVLIKRYYPNDFNIRISTFACVDTYTKAKYWESIGADIICVDFVKINRDFKTLKYMVDHLKNSKIELLVTNSCLKDCPMIYTHTNSLAHASNRYDSRKYEDWGLFFCQKKQLENLEEYIKSPWIRPEDIKYYEEIGIEHFKITERGFPTSELVKRVKAYCDRKYEGNLLDLIQGHGVVKAKKIDFQKKEANTRDELYNEIKRVRGLTVPRECEQHIFIDNKKLDGFISFFINNKCSGNCDSCGYCKKISEKVITPNDEVRDYLIKLYNEYDERKMQI